MDKISLPFRIVLIVALVFAVLWFVDAAAQARGRRRARRHGSRRDRPGQRRGQGEQGRRRLERGRRAPRGRGQRRRRLVHHRHHQAFDHERQARRHGRQAFDHERQARRHAAKPGATVAKPATAKPATAAKPAKPVAPAVVAKPAKPGLAADAAPGDPSRPLLASVDAGKVVVVLFWNKNASDDRATRRGLRSIDLHGGKVVASAVPIGDVGRYEAITRGVQVLESPTVLVIGAGGKARAITGYTQAKEIDQAVSDIGGKGFEAKKAFQHKGFAAVADDACKDFGYALEQKSNPPTTVAALSKALGTGAVELGHSRNRMAKAKATSADERKLKAALVTFADQDIKWVAEARSQLKAGAEPGTVFLTLVQRESDGNNAYVAAAKKLRVRGCYAGL